MKTEDEKCPIDRALSVGRECFESHADYACRACLHAAAHSNTYIQVIDIIFQIHMNPIADTLGCDTSKAQIRLHHLVCDTSLLHQAVIAFTTRRSVRFCICWYGSPWAVAKSGLLTYQSMLDHLLLQTSKKHPPSLCRTAGSLKDCELN